MRPVSADGLTGVRVPFEVKIWNCEPISPTLSMLVLGFGL